MELAPRATRDVGPAACAVGEAFTVGEAIAPFTVGGVIVAAFARASGGTSRSTPATAAHFSSGPTVE